MADQGDPVPHPDRAKWEDVAKGPGKFEGESPWVPYFYDKACDGFSDSGGTGWDWFELNQDDVAVFPELADAFGSGLGITLLYSTDGFVVGDLGTSNPEDDPDFQDEGSDVC